MVHQLNLVHVSYRTQYQSKKTSFEYDAKLDVVNTYINTHHSDANYASFNVHCNRSLCNTQSTLQAAKDDDDDDNEICFSLFLFLFDGNIIMENNSMEE